MKLFRHALARLLALSCVLSPIAANAQIVGPGSSSILFNGTWATYQATVKALAPAASATDFFTLTGATGKTVKIWRAVCNGQSTAAGNTVITALKRSTANTAGTAAVAPAVPLSTNNVAASAVARSYTANPTTGTLVGNIDNQVLFTQALSSPTGAAANLIFNFPNAGGENAQPVFLLGAGQVFALNSGGTSLPAGTVLNCTIVWTEQ